MCKKNLLNHIKYFSCNFYTTSWPRQLRLLSAYLHSFIVPWVRIQEADQKMHLIFFSSDFYIFFLCICVCNTKGDAHKPCGPPKREGKPISPRVWKDLAHCAELDAQKIRGGDAAQIYFSQLELGSSMEGREGNLQGNLNLGQLRWICQTSCSKVF